MSLNATPAAERIHIGFFGRRNAGKSSVVNAVTGQSLSIVSDVKGTTTDPVYKAMELLPLGPVMIIDTPGIDDEGPLGEERVRRTRRILNKIDVAVLVVDGSVGCSACGPGGAVPADLRAERELIALFKAKSIPWIVAVNKADLLPGRGPGNHAIGDTPLAALCNEEHRLWVSALTGSGIEQLKERIVALSGSEEPDRFLVRDLVSPLDCVVLVVPIDKAAPKGRLILPQQQMIRDLLEAGATSLVVRETELAEALTRLKEPPRLVITDSQAFGKVAADTPRTILLTSFSILLARYKGLLAPAVAGVAALKQLADGDRVLISEGCTHHRQCEDIGTVKLPGWIGDFCQKKLHFDFTSGRDFPEDLSPYRLIVHCGGCMLNEREMQYRMKCAQDQGVPITNYGILIAYVHGILERSLEPFPQIRALLNAE